MKRREIKFRIWDGERLYLINPVWFEENSWGSNDLNICAEEVNCVLMQYTGIKDKNGLEIYENDLVKVNDVVFEVKYGLQEVDAFEGYGFNIWSHFDADENGYHANGKRLSKDVEVVGNIYEGTKEDVVDLIVRLEKELKDGYKNENNT